MKKLILKATKKITLLVVLPWLLCIYSCKKDDNLGCHIDPFVYKHEWLKQLVQKAEDGNSGLEYHGQIFYEQYKGGTEGVFVKMLLEPASGGLYGHWFNLDGSRMLINTENPPISIKQKLIYSNLCKPLKKLK